MGETKRSNGVVQWLKPHYIISLVAVLIALGAVFAVFYMQRDQVVATVNGEKITRDDLYEAMYEQAGQKILEEMIEVRLILQEGERLGYSVSEEELDEEINMIILEQFMGMEDQFLAVLEQYGMTMAGLRQNLRVNMILNKIAEDKVEITEAEAQEFFAEYQDQFAIKNQVEARHILVDTEDEANSIIALLEQGGDFAELAGEYSLDTGSGADGGNLGFFEYGRMVEPFAEAAFSLAVGQRSGPVETDYGFHIIEVLDHIEARPVTYDEVAGQVKEIMKEEKVPEIIYNIVMELWEEANIDYKL